MTKTAHGDTEATEKPATMQTASTPLQLKTTLSLPQTDFPMKANLPQNEPARLEKWAKDDIYGQIRAARAGNPKYILHDGPPYANGPIHLGHALNKCLLRAGLGLPWAADRNQGR
jgi:isoleucyl-tRNA synthetase